MKPQTLSEILAMLDGYPLESELGQPGWIGMRFLDVVPHIRDMTCPTLIIKTSSTKKRQTILDLSRFLVTALEMGLNPDAPVYLSGDYDMLSDYNYLGNQSEFLQLIPEFGKLTCYRQVVTS